MRSSARFVWGSLFAAAVVSAACSREDGVQASDQPSGFLPGAASSNSNAPAGAEEATRAPTGSSPGTLASAPQKTVAAPSSGPQDVALAAALVHLAPQDLRAWLDQQKSSVDAVHRNWALACSLAANGAANDARALAKEVDADSLNEDERALLGAALGSSNARAIPASYGPERPTARAISMLLRDRDGRAALAANQMPVAARLYSSILVDELNSPWDGDHAALARWTDSLARAQRSHRWSARGAWPSLDVKVQAGDSLVLIRKRVLKEHAGMLFCTGLIAKANEMRDERALRPGDTLRVPTERASVTVDVSSRWLLYMLGDEVAAAFEIGVGRDGHDTPTGNFTVGEKIKNPPWFPNGKAPVPFGDPENPLGTRWICWMRDGSKTGYGFHGTNHESGVGGRVSQGCVRLRNVDAELLFEILPEGAEIRIQP